MMSNSQISLQIPPLMWQQIRQAMLDARRHHEETIGFLFCNRDRLVADRVRYLPRDWVVPAPDCYELQSASGLILKQDFHYYLLNKFIADRQLDVVHIHTHAGRDLPAFSTVDDRAESEYSQFLSREFSSQPRLISGVFDESLQHGHFRCWNRAGTACEPVAWSHGWLGATGARSVVANVEIETRQDEPLDDWDDAWESASAVPATPPAAMFDRQAIFGATAQARLGELTVALVGCGGIGAIVAETLGRLGVKKWILVDPDRLERVNLNRMPGATPEMVAEGWSKVRYLDRLIRQIYPTEAVVNAIPDTIANATTEVATADLIIVATDNHSSRQIAQEIALKYVRPLVCLGTHIDVKSDGTPRMYARVTVPPLGGGWCLMCGNTIDLQQAALESAPAAIDRVVASAGYLAGVADPAVFWLNGICASTGVGVIHGIVSGFIDVDAGIDWIYEFPSNEWHKTNPAYLQTDNCYFCSPV